MYIYDWTFHFSLAYGYFLLDLLASSKFESCFPLVIIDFFAELINSTIILFPADHN